MYNSRVICLSSSGGRSCSTRQLIEAESVIHIGSHVPLQNFVISSNGFQFANIHPLKSKIPKIKNPQNQKSQK